MLKFYADQALTQEITTLTTEHANTGAAVERRVFVANKDATKTYTNISVDIVDTAATDETTWVQLAQDNAGAAGAYSAAGVTLTMADITDLAAKSFWVKITTPSVADSQNKTDLQLKLLFREYAV
jgi:hypothetical protein